MSQGSKADNALLSTADVARLMKDPSASTRAVTADRLGASFSSGKLSASERSIAEEILRLMVRDVEVTVRQALSQSIRLSEDLPRDVAIAMANDVAEVALPFIETSSVLTDEDLLAIIQSKPEAYQVAVASRPVVSEDIADALVETGSEAVVTRLVSNEGAQLSEPTLGRVLDSYGHIKTIATPMAQRGALPIKIAERLVTLVSEKIRDHLMVHHAMSADMATDLLLDSRERATLHLLDGDSDTPDVVELVDQLFRNGRLTPTIVVRALCLGDLTFFEAALARRAGIPVANAYQLVHDRGGTGLGRLLERCQMPKGLWPVVKAALSAINDMDLSRSDDREMARTKIVERVLTQCGDTMSDNVDYLIAKIAGQVRAPRYLNA